MGNALVTAEFQALVANGERDLAKMHYGCNWETFALFGCLLMAATDLVELIMYLVRKYVFVAHPYVGLIRRKGAGITNNKFLRVNV